MTYPLNEQVVLSPSGRASITAHPNRVYAECVQVFQDRQRSWRYTRVVPPSEDFSAWRMTNFMDGRNGVYRWGYALWDRTEAMVPMKSLV